MKKRCNRPTLDSVQANGARSPRYERLEYEFEVIGPVFGGGVKPKKPDSITPIRGATIRGQLRFWWRATSRHKDLGSLRNAEDALWGSTKHPSIVSLSVDVQSSGPSILRRYPNPDDGIRYGDFPLRPGKGQANGDLHMLKGPVRLVLEVRDPDHEIGIRSTPVVDFPSQVQEIRDAVWAWLTFGGLGGRTRRGFGALAPTAALCNPRGLMEDPETALARLQENAQECPGVTSLAAAQLCLQEKSYGTCIEALNAGLDKLRMFRQGPGKGRHPGNSPKVPGKTRWPEASAIRKIQAGERPASAPPFPRAIFGMPIIFQNIQKHGRGDDPQVLPAGKDRRASPLILRPFRKSDGSFSALALVLSDLSHEEERVVLDLKDAKGTNVEVRQSLHPGEARWPDSPLDGNDDVLQAFLDYFEDN